MRTARPPARRGVLSRLVAVGGLSLLCAVEASNAYGAVNTAFLADKLRNDSDFRVRLNAALSLGTSDDAAAVTPLCGCLDDISEVETVRVACAAALGKLKKQGTDVCLKAHNGDSSAKVREQVTASLRALGGAPPPGSGPDQCPGASAPAAGGKPKYYVGVAITNKSSRPDGEIKSIVAREVRCKLTTMPRFRIAPDDASDPKTMASAASKEKLEGYFLAISLEAFKYAGGVLKVTMKLAILTHTRDLKGELTKELQIPVDAPSKPDEDTLIKAAAQRLANSFADLKQ